MYERFRQFCERLLRIPPAPEPPPGDETQTRLFRAAPNYYKYLLALCILKMAATFLILLVSLAAPLLSIYLTKGESKWTLPFFIFLGIVLGIKLVLDLIALVVVRLDFEKRWYLVTDRSLRVREGILMVREATITFANIQNISISQGPIQRVLGIADLRVDTAGGGGVIEGKRPSQNLHTAWFRGVSNANEIRELMQQRLRQLKDSGLGDHEELTAQRPVAVSSSIVVALREVRVQAGALREAAARRSNRQSRAEK